MGNNTSNKPGGADVAGGAYSPTSRDENVYDQSFPPPAPPSRRFTASTQSSGPYAAVSRVSPPLPPRSTVPVIEHRERRSQTVVARPTSISTTDRDTTRATQPISRRLSTSDVSSSIPALTSSDSDDLSSHVTKITPGDQEANIPLDSKITVYFDRDVKTVNINKLFEVTCNSIDPSLNPVKGRISYDARQQKAEFIPQNTLYPGAKYSVILVGRAVTTSTCTHSSNIKNAEYQFQTASPPPKTIGIKLKGSPEEFDNIQIANYFDLFNSLVVWSTRKWGCSGEYITGMFTENTEGKLLPLKTDHDVLNLKERDIITVEIKD